MARIWRTPGALMTAYVVVFAMTPVPQGLRMSVTTLQLTADVLGVAIGAFLAWRVTRGSAFARGILVAWTIGLVPQVLWGRDLTSGGLVGLGLLASYLVQVALLVSTPVYERTRKDWADLPPTGALGWPTPRWWMAATALAAGLLITLLFLASMGWQSVPCAPLAAVTQAKCVTLAQGFPVHFLSAIPTVGRVAYPAINKGAAAEDMTVWIVLSFAACYLIWLPSHRPSRDAVARIAAPV